MTAVLESLFEPATLGPVTVANRVFVAPHTTNFAPPGVNQITDRHLAYHERRAAGGAGLIITEGIRVHPTSLRRLGVHAYADDALPGLTALAERVHSHGARLFAQLLHTGRHTGDERRGAWAPSPIPWSVGNAVPHAMNRFDIDDLVESFAEAAGRVLDAGFDGMEVHLGHGHLLQQFLSPITNKRDDEYGGDYDGRLRLAREVLVAVQRVVGERGALGVRLSADEFLEGGLTPDDTVRIIRDLHAVVPLDFLHVSHAAYIGAPSLDTQMADMTWPTAPFRHLPARFKREFPDVPVLAVCRIDNLETGAEIIRAGDADLVGFARAHIADPALVAKARGDGSSPVRSCIACNQGCNYNLELVTPITCTVNPEVGMEDAWAAARAAQRASRRVLVVGGGPAGLEAAATAARFGHAVELWEGGSRLGGKVPVAAALPGRDRFGLLASELIAEAEAAGVSISCDRVAVAADIAARQFDVVVLATGAAERAASGLDLGDVRTASASEAIANPESLGGHVVVLDELGTWPAAGTAELLAGRGARVELVSAVGGAAWNVTVYSRLALLDRLGALGVKVRPFRTIARVDGDAIVLRDVVGGDEETIGDVSGVVHVAPAVASDALLEELRAARFSGEVHLVGDAYAPRTCLEAVYDGRVVGTVIGVTDDAAVAGILPRAAYKLAA